MPIDPYRAVTALLRAEAARFAKLPGPPPAPPPLCPHPCRDTPAGAAEHVIAAESERTPRRCSLRRALSALRRGLSVVFG